jgi:glyoxylase-like metal-dependent hydrolase (beta-lactamase superfamily II)
MKILTRTLFTFLLFNLTNTFSSPQVEIEPPPGSISVTRFETGYNDSPEGLIIENGSFFDNHRSTHSAFLIKHPQGNFLIDTGLSKKIDKQFEDFTWWLKPFFSYSTQGSVKETLRSEKINIDFIFLTHLHWDHASAISDFPNSSIYVSKKEKEQAFSKESSSEPGFLKNQYQMDSINWKEINFKDMKYGAFKRSVDLFNDGSLIAVELPGHTLGSTGYFLTLNSGKKFFFVGDTIWSVKQLKKGTHKFSIAKCLVDHDPDELLKTIKVMKKIKLENPNIVFIPSHDFSHISKQIPLYPSFIF